MSKEKKRSNEENNKKETLFYYEIIGVVLILVSFVILGKLGKVGILLSKFLKCIFGNNSFNPEFSAFSYFGIGEKDSISDDDLLKCLYNVNYFIYGDNVNIDKMFDYLVPDNLIEDIKVGIRVEVPFGNQILDGFVLEIKDNLDSSYELKEIIRTLHLFQCFPSCL